jgi:hypothetical protein
MTKEQLLDKVPKARRKKLEEELTNIVDQMATHMEKLIPIKKEYELVCDRYARLKVEDGVVTKLLEAIFEEQHPDIAKEYAEKG